MGETKIFPTNGKIVNLNKKDETLNPDKKDETVNLDNKDGTGNLEEEKKKLENGKKELEENLNKLNNDKKELETNIAKLAKEKEDFEDEKKLEDYFRFIRPGVGLYLISMVLILTWVGIENFFSPTRATSIHTVIYVACAGGIGASIAALTAFNGHQKDFQISFVYWYVFRPIVGIVMGILVYILLFTALPGLNPLSSSVSSTSLFACIAVAFIVGYASKQFAVKLKELATTLFPTTITGDKSPTGSTDPDTAKDKTENKLDEKPITTSTPSGKSAK